MAMTRKSSVDAADRGDELAHDGGPLGVAEIEVVGDRQRVGADRGEVPPGLGHRLLGALERIGGAVARGHVGREGKRLGGAVDAHHPRIAAGALDGVALDEVVVLLHTQRRDAMSGEPTILRSTAA